MSHKQNNPLFDNNDKKMEWNLVDWVTSFSFPWQRFPNSFVCQAARTFRHEVVHTFPTLTP